MTHFRSSRPWVVSRFLLLTIPLLLSTVAVGQTTRRHAAAAAAAAEESPIFHEYRGIQIGWVADDVRKKLGAPADKGEEQDFYVFGEKETCQILYDKTTKKVTAISVDYMNGAADVITPQQVFGSDFETKSDGSKHKLVRYPKAGYWVSYSRTAGETPIITVTMQALPRP
ncbi:MAG TPA: hypothetical protein VGW58_12630 [Pyrinomonadaceae bacterium]|nr:hypothetical protein [Pyrinomonadaceae bacterium]